MFHNAPWWNVLTELRGKYIGNGLCISGGGRFVMDKGEKEINTADFQRNPHIGSDLQSFSE